MGLLEFTDRGIYCPQANVYLDPWKPVDSALITHGHSDHARFGHKNYLCVESSVPIIRHRLQLSDPAIQSVTYGETISIQGVDFSFHPAGHIPGSIHIPLGYLPDRAHELPRGKPVVVFCQTGSRSAIAASVLQAEGMDNVRNVHGGYAEWARGAPAIQD